MRTEILFIVGICLCLAVRLTGAEAAQEAVTDEQVAREIQKLIPEASGIPIEAFNVMARSEAAPNLKNIEDQPLSLVLLMVPMTQRTKEKDAEFRFLKAAPRPSELASEMSRTVAGTRIPATPYATFLHANRITKVTAGVKGDEARGKIGFRVPDLYEGAIDYVAKRENGKWTVTEFQLPAHGWSIVRDKEGRWKATQKELEGKPDAKR